MITSLLLLGSLAAPPAEAARLKKMSDDQVVVVLREDDKTETRVEAAVELGLRRSALGVPYLGAACERDPELVVCEAAVSSLEVIQSAESRAELQQLMENEEIDESQRLRAIVILADQDPDRLQQSLPRLVARYSHQPEALGASVFLQVRELELTQLDDAALFVASDADALRGTRLSAMATAEAFGHARLHEAWLVNLPRDPDRGVRQHCAEELGRPGLPGSTVVPALTLAVERDKEGAVRAAALTSLLQYAHDGLLPMLHDQIVQEKHPYAWAASLNLLLPLANSSSIKPISKRLEESERMKTADLKRIVELFVRFQDPAVVQPLLALEQRHQGSELAEQIREALALYEDEDRLAQAASMWRPRVDFTPWVPGSTDPTFPDLTVEMGPGKVLEGVPGGP